MTPAATRADVLMVVARAGSALSEVQRIVAEAQIPYPRTAREIRAWGCDRGVPECAGRAGTVGGTKGQ